MFNMSNFAKKQLLKYGWSEGKGLGKNENGIVEALRPKLKFNNEGLGYNSSPGTEWWQTTFDKAAKNIVINKENDEISFSISNKNSTAEKATKVMLKSKQSRQKQYNNFRRLELLDCSEPETSKKIKNIEKEKVEEIFKRIPILTDDEIFKACGSRTGHKGARHGLTMSGKLERIHQQEKKLLHLMKHLTLKNIAKTTIETDGDIVAKLNNNNNNNNNNANVAITTTDESCSKESGFQIVKSRSAIRREKKNMHNLTRLLNNACNIGDITCGSNITETKKNLSHKHKKSKDKKNKIASIRSEIVTPPEEKHDLVNIGQLLHDKTECKKHKEHNKLFLITQESTPVYKYKFIYSRK